MASTIHDDFEEQLAIQPAEDQEDTFKPVHPAWSHAHNQLVTGSTMLAQAALAVYQTLPKDVHIHTVQAQFLKAAPVQHAVQYEVERTVSTARTACRVVRVKSQGVLRVLATFSCIAKAREDAEMQPFDHIPHAGKDLFEAAARPIDPEPGKSFSPSRLLPQNWPSNVPYPAISSQVQEVALKDKAAVSKRVYRIKMRSLSPLSSPSAQIAATIFFSDLYVLDTPLTVQGLSYGGPKVGDKAKKPTKSHVRNLVTMNYTLHFVRGDGRWDVHEGLLMECVSMWAKGRRGVNQISIRDVKGSLIATGEQEGYYLFKEGVSAKRQTRL